MNVSLASGESCSSWTFRPLGFVARLVNGKAFAESDWSSAGIPIIRIQNLNDPGKPFNYWSGDLRKQVLVEPGDLLLAWSGTPGTSFGAHIWARGKGVLNQHIFRVDVEESMVDRSWLQLAINVQLKALIGKAHGAVGLRHVTRREVESLQVPLPSMAEQRLISGKLDQLLGHVDRARAAVEARLEAAEALRRSLLRRVFTSRKSELWPTTVVGDVCDIQLGKMLSPKSKMGLRPAPYLRNANIQWDRFDLRDVATMDFDDRERGKFLLVRNDLLVCEGGEPGRCAVWNGEIDPCFYQKALHRLRPKSDAIDPHFLMLRLWHGSFEGEFEGSHAQTTIAHLPAVRLAKLELRVPPIDDQRRIVAATKAQLTVVDRTRTAANEEREALNHFPAALLTRAVRGEL